MYYGDYKNVNNQYLSSVFCRVFESWNKLPVYQIEFTKGLPALDEIQEKDAFVLMVCGNENHLSVDHYLEDKRVKAIVKNYPRLKNVSKDPEIAQEFNTVTYVETDGRTMFVVEKEQENIITIPLGVCNNFNPVVNCSKTNPGGFIGQYTTFRHEKIDRINNSFSGSCPYIWGFYRGFGPFVQAEIDQDKENFSLTTADYSDFLSNSEVCFAPSGQSPETYRLFEAAMAGCVLVHDVLPEVWYYDSLPHVPLNTSNFQALHEYIQQNKKTLQNRTALWWRDYVSPIAVGTYVAKSLKEINL